MLLLRLFFVYILQFVFIKEVITANLECYTTYDSGASYNGTVTRTQNGTICLNWGTVTNNSPHYFENHNYCRNPFNLQQPWCYTERTKWVYDYCDIPTCGCRQSIEDRFYDGHIGITKNGYACSVWGGYKGLTTSNDKFCRTPAGDNEPIPWCYTGIAKFRWDRCNVPVCNGRVCPDLSNHHLEALDGKARYQYGESVIVHCKDGYTMISGQKYLTCLNSGKWNDTLPKCEAVTCGHVNQIISIHVEPAQSSYGYKEKITMTCTPGFTGTEVYAVCTQTGNWSKSPPVCTRVTCGPVPRNTLFVIEPAKSTYDYKESITITCKPGFTGKEVSAVCTQAGNWSNGPPVCTRVTCGPVSKNTLIVVEPAKSTYAYKESITITCKPGFTGKEVSAVCTQAGNWSFGSPVCTSVTCGPVPNHISFDVEPVNITYAYKKTITMTCKPGFTGIKVSAVCTQAGNWSHGPPVCTPLLCPTPSLPEHASRKVNDSGKHYYGENVMFLCEHGYNLKGSGISYCTVNGSNLTVWNYDSQRCEGVLCHPPNVSDNNIVQNLNKRLYRFLDNITFDCVEGFELEDQKSVRIDCVVDENNKTSGKWNGEIPVCQAKSSPKHSSITGPAVGGGIGAAVVILVVSIVIVIIIRRRSTPTTTNKEKRYKESTLELTGGNIYAQVEERATKTDNEVSVNNAYFNEIKEDTETGGYYAFNVGSQLPTGAIEVKNFFRYVEKGRGKEGDIEKEFQNLKSGLQKSTDAALKPGNRMKNKYKDMYAYDETRVMLDKPKESHNSDYINASFIQGYGQVRKYIAAQGPLDKTVNDFWRMVWEYDCGKIVMLTNVFENGKQKCIQYWPDHEQQRTAFGSISILCVKEDVYSDFTIRRLDMQKENETKTVLQFHFTAWPDKDVPKYASSLVHFRHKVNTTRTLAKGPLVVHCSAGVGRTGTYIALDYIVNEAKERDYVEVFRSVEILRNQRVNMVQTAHQYLFLHEAVVEALMCPNSGIPCRDFPDSYKGLMRFDNIKKKHKLQIEYELMNSISSRHDEEAFSKGRSEENRGKNRYSNIIPVGSEMPLLSTAVDERNEYINAVFLPGYRNNKTFIVTQMPLETTVVDLWRLVHDYEIPTIVMLNTDIQTGKSTNVYWPEGDKHVTYGPFNITRTNTNTQNLYTCLDLTYKYKTQESRQVKLFQSKFWEENMINPGSANDMLSFLSTTEDGHSNTRGCGPVLVHCLNGCDKSGLYCVLATVIERLRIEQDVDIQHIIKQMRNRRPQIISNYEQFQFIYEAVIEYLKEFETYSNFQ